MKNVLLSRQVIVLFLIPLFLLILSCSNKKTIEKHYTAFHPQQVWKDTKKNVINAHGGGMLYHKGYYYWVGEDKDNYSSKAHTGIHLYRSKDLYNWTDKGIILKVDSMGSHSDIESGCIMERPKLVYNAQTKKYVLWFHLELKDQGYSAARYGVAIADAIEGPYKFLYSSRSCAQKWPINWDEKEQKKAQSFLKKKEVRLKDHEWFEQNKFLIRDFHGGQMSRDMTVYVDDDGEAYRIFASEENGTLHIARLNNDYTHETGEYIRIFPGRSNEAPTLFKHQNKYWMITSGCTGWAPNKARLAVADSIMGEWTELDNPCIDTKNDRGEYTKYPKAELTFGTQSTYVFRIEGSQQFVFMADEWRPKNQTDSRYVWLPIHFKEGKPFIKWKDKWEYTALDLSKKE